MGSTSQHAAKKGSITAFRRKIKAVQLSFTASPVPIGFACRSAGLERKAVLFSPSPIK